MNTLHLEDFVVLGRTVPEESKKYGQRVCMAGYSPGNAQFLRVYPLLVPVGENREANGFRARHQYAMNLVRNPNDSRLESWRVADEKRPSLTAWDGAPELKKATVVDWLRKRVVSSIWHLNECRLSLGVLHLAADEWDGVIMTRGEAEADPHSPGLFDDLDAPDLNADDVRHVPYIRFADRHTAGGSRQLQVREWGAYQLLANPRYENNPDVLWGAHGYRTGSDLIVVVGNMCHHRNVWLIIKTFEIECRSTEPNLFSDIEATAT